MMELLSRDNPCGWNLLTIVSRGSSIIAEIQRLSQFIPEDFTFPKSQTNHPYARILYDYDYFDHDTEIELMIEKDPELNELNDECRETHVEIVTRFCRLFESIVRYALDFIHYLEQLSQEYFLQMNIETLMNETEGKQLLGEALYLYGVMLLQLDYHIPGLIRERLLIAFNRWRGSSMILNYAKVCDVCRSTGFSKDQPVPPTYPCHFINRIPMPESFIKLLVGRYRNDDVYMNMPNYPDAEHRAVALSTQAQMLFIFLFFSPDTLESEEFVMREIVDKFFFDNWNVPYYMGYYFELPVVWKNFNAAYLAISNTMKSNAVRYYQRMVAQMPVVHQKIKEILSDGFTKIDQLLDGINNYVKVVRDGNVVLRFLVLHTQSPSKKAQFPLDRDELLAFLLDLAQFEYELKTAVDNALTTKAELWIDERSRAVNALKELGLSFSGTLSLSALTKDENLQNWFENIANEVEALENENNVANVQKIYQLTSALEKITQYHQISQSIFIKESVGRVVASLKTLGRLLNIDDKYTPLISTLSDFSYGFACVYQFIPLMQKRIKVDPFSVLKLRATFLKMTSLLDLQLVRILQCESNDVDSVSEHYSSLIVDFVRLVLEIVPISIFNVLTEIINLRTNVIKDLPNRIERQKLKEYAQLEERGRLAILTKEISILTSGVLAMKTTLMGVITVDPKQMLEEGIRKQLVKKVIDVLYLNLVPKKGEPLNPVTFNALIDNVGRALDGIRHSFEYMGDYVNMDGLRIWHHEYSRIMCFLVEQESNKFLRKKILPWQSEFQSKVAPIEIPKVSPKSETATCLGSFTAALVELTKHESGVYCGITGGWINIQNGEEVLGTKTINRMCNAIGIEGTSSVDNLLSFTLAGQLKHFFETFDKANFSNFGGLMNQFLDTWPSPPQNYEVYNELFSKIKPELHNWTQVICKIGQIQLLKATIDAHMNLKCELEAQSLHFMLTNTNDTVLQAIKQFYRDPTHNPYPSNQLIGVLSAYLENCGMCEPLEKIYTLSRSLPEMGLILFAITIMNLNNSKVTESEALHMLVKPRGYAHYEFVVGIITILRQMNVAHTYAYLTFIGQYANLLLAQPLPGAKKEAAGGIDILRPFKFLMIYVKDYEVLAKCPRRMIDTFIPPTIFDFISI